MMRDERDPSGLFTGEFIFFAVARDRSPAFEADALADAYAQLRPWILARRG